MLSPYFCTNFLEHDNVRKIQRLILVVIFCFHYPVHLCDHCKMGVPDYDPSFRLHVLRVGHGYHLI